MQASHKIVLTKGSGTTSIENKKGQGEGKLSLTMQRIGKSTLELSFNQPHARTSRIRMYNPKGVVVKEVNSDTQDGGTETIQLSLEGVSAGIYLVQLEIAGVTQTMPITVVK